MSEENQELVDNLKLECDSLGINYTASATVKSLNEKITAYRDASATGSTKAKPEETITDAKEMELRRKQREQSKLTRVIVSCNDPKLQNRQGILRTVSNSIVNFKKVVPFDHPVHLPMIILESLKDAKHLTFHKKRLAGGAEVSEPKEVRTYNIEYLDPLTAIEIDRIAIRQSAQHTVGD